MLIDKGYFDYDFTDEKPLKETSYEFMGKDEVANLLSGAINPQTNERVFKESAEDLQNLAMEK
jgi:hypothetical protein